MHNVIYKGENTPLFFKYYKDIDESKIKLYIYNNDNEYIEIDTSFKKIDRYYYKCIINLNQDCGTYYFKVTDDNDNRIGGGVLQIRDNILKRLENFMYGNWEIKDNKMYFYDLQNNILAIYKLYDKNGSPTMSNVFKREKE